MQEEKIGGKKYLFKMTSLDVGLSQTNAEILRRNIRSFCVDMKDSEDFSKYETLLEDEAEEAWGLKEKELSVPPVFAECQNDNHSSDPDEIPPTPLPPSIPEKKKTFSIFEVRNLDSDLDDEESEIPSTPPTAANPVSPLKRAKPSKLSRRSSKRINKGQSSSLSKTSSPTTSSLDASNIFNADNVINKELEGLVPKNSDGTQSKRVISKYTSDNPRKSSLGMTRRGAKRPSKKTDSPSVKQFFTPVRGKVSKKSIDELLNSPPDECERVSPSTWTSLEEITKELKKMCSLSKKRSSRLEEGRKVRKDYKESSSKMRDELISKVSPSDMKKWVSDNKEYINKVWSGDVESSRYKAFYRSNEARHGLLYHMITHPFTDRQVEAAFEAISSEWMSTKDLFNERSDFVWKVVLAEVLIKVYSETFDISDKTEAEKRIASTPLDSDDENNHW